MIKEFLKSMLIASIVLGLLYSLLKIIFWIGPVYVFGFMYLLLGFIVAFETRETSEFNYLAWILVVFWLPAIVVGIVRKIYWKGESLTAGIREGVVEELEGENQ